MKTTDVNIVRKYRFEDAGDVVKELRKAAACIYLTAPEAVADAQSALYTEAAQWIEDLVQRNGELARPIAKQLVHDGMAKIWHPILTAPTEKLVMLWAPTWHEPGTGMIDRSGRAYSPCCGADLQPAPTEWKQLPDAPPRVCPRCEAVAPDPHCEDCPDFPDTPSYYP